MRSTLIKSFLTLWDNIKKNPGTLALLAACVCGLFFHLSNLQGCAYLEEDEARPFTLLPTGPLMYLMGKPIYNLFHTQSSVFYLAGILGCISIVLFYRILRFFFDKNLSALATLLYACFPLRIDFARTLFPSVFLEFYFLLSLCLLCYGVLRKKHSLVILSGCSCALLLLTHGAGYCMIVNSMVALPCLHWLHSKQIQPKNLFNDYGKFLLGFLFVYLLIEVILHYVLHAHSLSKGYALVALFAKGVFSIFEFLHTLFLRTTSSTMSVLISTTCIISFFFLLIKAITTRKKELILLLLFFLPGCSILVLFSLLRIHALYERHFIWLGGLFSFSIAFLIITLYRSTKKTARALSAITFLLIMVLLCSQSFFITREMFTISEMTGWLKKRNIKNSSVMTYWKIGELKDPIFSYIPTLRTDQMKNLTWFMSPQEFHIAWPYILYYYLKDEVRYILTSGISLRATLGENEPFLANVQPRMSWVHPYHKFRHRYCYSPHPFSIKLYDLADVFTKEKMELYNYFNIPEVKTYFLKQGK